MILHQSLLIIAITINITIYDCNKYYFMIQFIKSIGAVPYNGLFSNEFYFRIIRRGSLLRKFNSSNNKKPTINSNCIVRSRATTRECGCHGIASLFQDFQQTSRIAMALY